MVIATIIGARLGHVIFYQPEMLWEEPLSVFLPFEFSPFRFTGLQGLASHGAAIGILFALWLYARKRKPGQSYFQVVDRIVILVALTGALIRTGNYFNSEIIGKPTEKAWGVVFANRYTEALEDRKDLVEDVEYKRNDSIAIAAEGRIPLDIYVFFKKGVSESEAARFVDNNALGLLSRYDEYFDANRSNTTYKFSAMKDGTFGAKITTVGIARHPAQLYEAIACVILFAFLFMIWNRYREALPPGRLLGIFLIWCFGLRFLFEFLKVNQVAFEDKMSLNMGQILSIPFFILGIIILVLSYRKKEA
jgi:prolipoprotein diacylglyceryltransferase